jgi:hypothetical protein
MHFQHIESISWHTGNISGGNPPSFPPHTVQRWHLTAYCEPKVQNPTQTLVWVKENVHGILIELPLPNPNINVVIWHPTVHMRVRMPPRNIRQLKAWAIPLIWTPKWAETLILGICHGIFIEPPPKSKYQNWYLTLCCGLVVQNPTKALMSVKDPDNIFELTLKWASTLPSVGNFPCDIYRVSLPLGFKSKVFKRKIGKPNNIKL